MSHQLTANAISMVFYLFTYVFRIIIFGLVYTCSSLHSVSAEIITFPAIEKSCIQDKLVLKPNLMVIFQRAKRCAYCSCFWGILSGVVPLIIFIIVLANYYIGIVAAEQNYRNMNNFEGWRTEKNNEVHFIFRFEENVYNI